jgi:hypothetical protein
MWAAVVTTCYLALGFVSVSQCLLVRLFGLDACHYNRTQTESVRTVERHPGYDTANDDRTQHLTRGLNGWPLPSHSFLITESAAPTALFCCLTHPNR